MTSSAPSSSVILVQHNIRKKKWRGLETDEEHDDRNSSEHHGVHVARPFAGHDQSPPSDPTPPVANAIARISS
jgi:hypothetical protein